jgi:hypothetical protein
LGIVTLGAGTTQAIDVIRRPAAGESPKVTADRYFAEASLKFLLSDNPQDIMNLPCVDAATPPLNLADLVGDPTNPLHWTSGNAIALKTIMNNRNAAGFQTTPVSLAASGANVGAAAYNTADGNGYWEPGPAAAGGTGTATIKGYIKIEIQTSYAAIPCGAIRDVTLDVLGYGYAGRNINPLAGLNTAPGVANAYGVLVNPAFSATGANPPLLALVPGQVAPSNCPDVHPNAIIRIQRLRDNPSTWATSACGLTAAGVPPTGPTDYWPNVLFDPREGTLRDNFPTGNLGVIPYNTMVSLNGVMSYIEIDANNLIRYLTGALPGQGTSAFDPSSAPNDYAVYISDRRGNYIPAKPATAWPPVSPSNNETGEYGFEDFTNLADPNGCPNGVMDAGEDLDGLGNAVFFTYGQDATRASQTIANGGNGYYGAGSPATVAAALVGGATTNAIAPNPKCPAVAAPTSIWPFSQVIHANEARENPNFFFRRAVKIVNGANVPNVMNNCPGNILCGLTIAAENPIYIQGDYNCVGCTGNAFSTRHVAASVLGDAVTLLSNRWNDVNSFIGPYNIANGPVVRNASTTYYRVAIMGGKGVSFPQPTAYASPQDFGTDGGLHNFLRYIENWGGQTLNYKGSLVSLFFNRQATGAFKCCTDVYSPPSRGYNFDVEFLQPNLLPPRTPLFRDVNTTGFTQLLLSTQ